MNKFMGTLNQVKNIYSFWGRLPVLYTAQDYFTFMGRPGFIRKKAVTKLNVRKGDKILEVACGTGRNFPYIMKALGKEGVLIGFDYVQEMLDAAKQLCKRRGWDNVKLIQGDAAELKIGEEKFSGILSVLGISAIPGWEQALLRCFEALTPGGKLVVCDARPFHGTGKFFNPLIKAIYSRFAAWDSTKNIPEKMKEIFKNVQIEEFNFGTFFIAVSTKR